jgi:hypothetical protein
MNHLNFCLEKSQNDCKKKVRTELKLLKIEHRNALLQSEALADDNQRLAQQLTSYKEYIDR